MSVETLVLLTWVITADEQHFARCLRISQPDLGAVTEAGRGRGSEAEPAIRSIAGAGNRSGTGEVAVPWQAGIGKSTAGTRHNDNPQVSGH